MTLDQLNNALGSLKAGDRDSLLAFAYALVQFMGITPNDVSKPRLQSPHTVKLKDSLVPAPQTVQPQLYRISEEGHNIRVRLATLKKIRKETITLLVDQDPGMITYQASMKGVINIPGREPYISSNPYYIHFVTTASYDHLLVIVNQGDQKRIIRFKGRFSNTQFNKIIPQWKNIGTKTKPEIAESIWKSLDIKEVNKDFYKQIKERFDALIGIVSAQVSNTTDQQCKQFAVRLIGRYLFCWFLKEKNIIPGRLLASETILENENDFFQQYLYRLFFKTLNEQVQSRTELPSETALDCLYHSIPYLNGGLFDQYPEDQLFEKLEMDDWLVAFVRILESFDFTVDESSSQYQQVAVDPEMLGRIFENLLASQNEETANLANQRKAFGAFYTPREIVDYMVNESLKAYLETQLLPRKEEAQDQVKEPLVDYKGTLFAHLEPQQILMDYSAAARYDEERRATRLKDKINKLFSPDCTDNPFDKSESEKVRQALSEVKILDPACGSGAFPMGVLLRLTELRQIVGHGHKNNYELKSEILSKNIFGVDIMPMAVEIARLRAWLSLVLEADYKPTDRKNNFGVAALPNLDFKFVCANSLIDSGYDAFLENVQHNLTLMRLDGEIQKLERLRDAYFDPKGDKSKKHQLQQEFYTTKDYIKKEFKSVAKTWKLQDFLSKVDDWNPFDDSHPSSFFSPAWMFGVKSGFDVVIGNPPYVQMQKSNGQLAEQLKDAGYTTFERTGDIYALFYELGFKVLAYRGVHTFITSSQWLKAAYGKSLRKLFLSKNPIKLIALGPGIFESAVVDTNILIAQNSRNENILVGSTIEKPEQLIHLNTIAYHSMPYVTVENWAIMDVGKQSVTDKIKAKGKELKQWDITIYFGIKTGYNEAFIIDDDQQEELIRRDAKSIDIIKPVLRGREIDKYHTEWAGGYLISTFPTFHIDINNYRTVKKYLERFLPKLRQEGKTYINSDGKEEKTRKKTNNKWFETQDQIGYYKDLSKEKIIWKRIGSQLRFSYSDSEIYCLDSTCIATGEKIKYLTALLNSKLCNYQLFESAPRTGMGDLIISVQALEPLLVYYPTDKEQKIVEKLVDEILKRKKAKQDTTALENEIDVLVYKLYELTYDEVKIIDKDFWLSEEEYEKVKVE